MRVLMTQARRHAAGKASVTTTAEEVGGEVEGDWANSDLRGHWDRMLPLAALTALRTKGGEELYGDI